MGTQKGTLLTELNNIDLRKDIFTIQYDDFWRKNQTVSPDTGITRYDTRMHRESEVWDRFSFNSPVKD